MGLERLVRSRLGRGLLVMSVFGCAAIPAATATGATQLTPVKHKTAVCGVGTPCKTTVASPLAPAAPGSTGGGGSGPVSSMVSVDVQRTHGRIASNSDLQVNAYNSGPKLVCPGYTRRVTSWFEFTLTANRQFGITYEVTDAIHNSTRQGIHICVGLGYKFTTLSGDPARRAELPDGTKGYVGLLPLCQETADGSVLSKGPCVSFLVEATGSNGPATFAGVQIPAMSQSDPWMGG